MESIEIYPRIIVYKNVFKDIKKTFSILEESTLENPDRILGQWNQWSSFGKYLEPLGNFWYPTFYRGLEKVNPQTKTQQNQKDFLIELINGFHQVTDDYCKKNKIIIDKEEKKIAKDGQVYNKWQHAGPSIAQYHKKYKINDEISLAMLYHSDYIREPIKSPGYKFVITALAYFNEDYDGGEIEFAIGKKLIRYKPAAGDYIVFPSGHPDFLTDGQEVYLHSVQPTGDGNHKYLSRSYWQVYEEGSDEWYEKEKEFGKENWLKMYKNIAKEWDKKNPQRSYIENGVHIL
jgi:hypothetical protein